MFTSCVSYKPAVYKEATMSLSPKLPKLSLEVDTVSISWMFYRSNFYIEEFEKSNNDGQISILHANYSMPDINNKGLFEWSFISSAWFDRENPNIYTNESDFYADYPHFLTDNVAYGFPTDERELKLAFEGPLPENLTGNSPYKLELLQNMEIKVFEGEAKYELRVADQLDYLQSVVENKICDQSSELSGIIKFEILESYLNKGLVWLVPSVLTLFTINLFGFPVSSQSIYFNLKCTITNISGQEIYSNIAHVDNTNYSAMYWGYGMMGAASVSGQAALHRSVNMKSLSEAVNIILKDIQVKRKDILSALQ